MLVVGNMSKSFGGLKAVSEMNFSLNQGEILGLIGPNGAGKTTVFNLLSGFLKPDFGRITFQGEDITGLKPNEICFKGLVRTFQIVQTFNNLTTLQNTVISALNRCRTVSEARAAAESTLAFVGLERQRNQLAKNLTLANCKALEIAKALATQPKLILLDEVMAGLNPTEVRNTIELITKIRDRGITIFLTEHVMHAIMKLSERIIVMHHGEKIAEGTPREIAQDRKVIDAYLGEEFLIA